MTAAEHRVPEPAAAMRLLVREDLRRLRARLRHPTAATLAGGLLPLLLFAGLLASLGPVAAPRVAGRDDAVLLGVLVSGAVSFLAYPLLFRGEDAPLLRRLGVHPRAISGHRSLRLLLGALGVAVLLMLPFATSGAAPGGAPVAALASAMAAWGVASAALPWAARALARHEPGRGWGLLSAGMWDRDLAASAPLVWAPLPPLLAGPVAAGWTAAGSAGWRLAAVAIAAGALAALGARWYADALPRFAPMVLEMAFDPPPSATAGELRVGGGVAALLPRRAAAVWARDSLVAGRRFGWAERAVWPVAIASVVALARWGEFPTTRGWVAAGVLLVLGLQGAAALGLGRLERGRRRWIDRAVGVGWSSRLLGRWAWGWGRSLWLTVPLGLAWHWWSGAGAGWAWVLLGGLMAGAAAAASLLTAGWR